mgnify:CR=1 FL=1
MDGVTLSDVLHRNGPLSLGPADATGFDTLLGVTVFLERYGCEIGELSGTNKDSGIIAMKSNSGLGSKSMFKSTSILMYTSASVVVEYGALLTLGVVISEAKGLDRGKSF